MSKNARHTDGPWKIYTNAAAVEMTAGIIASSASKGYQNRWIATVFNSDLGIEHYAPGDEAEANARLIAAAPDLLEACKTALDYLLSDGNDGTSWPHTEDLREAIALAEGS